MTDSHAASSGQAEALDAAAESNGVPVQMLMALASLQCASLANSLLLDLSGPHSRVAVMVGKGNNGGDALGCARHLSSWGFEVRCLTVQPREQLAGASVAQALAAERSGVEIQPIGANPADLDTAATMVLEEADLVVDGLLGSGSRGAPRGDLAALVLRINRSSAPVLAIDIPSGLDPSTGLVEGDCVRADHTLMLGIAKVGCELPSARHWVGQLWLADIGIPAAAYRECGLMRPSGLGPEPVPYQPSLPL
jgi:NAD(P)H-hydrate epimerase